MLRWFWITKKIVALLWTTLYYTCTRMTGWLFLCQFLLVYHIYSKDSTSSCRYICILYMHTRDHIDCWKLTAIDCSRHGDLIVLPLSDPCASSHSSIDLSPSCLCSIDRSLISASCLVGRNSQHATGRVKIENPKSKRLQRWWRCWQLDLSDLSCNAMYVNAAIAIHIWRWSTCMIVERMNHDGWLCVW